MKSQEKLLAESIELMKVYSNPQLKAFSKPNTSTKGSIAEKGGVSSAGKLSEGTLSDIIEDIQNGSGWTTADYITNAPHVNLSEAERVGALLKLAKEGCLVDETKLTGKEKTKEEIDPSCFMTVDEIRSKYGKIKERYKKKKKNESMNERATIDSLYADEIARLVGARSKAVKDFIERNDIDDHDLFQYLTKAKLKEKMGFITALVGNPGNKYEKEIVKKFSK